MKRLFACVSALFLFAITYCLHVLGQGPVDKEKQKGNANRTTLAVARKLVAYLMAIDRGQRNFKAVETNCVAA